MTPTPEQVAIIDAARGTRANLLVNALAGAAKTTTLQLICEAVTGIPILSLAFNKRIAEEMTKRLPSHVKCQTLNSLGHQVWGKALGKRLTLDTSKTHQIIRGLIDEAPKGSKPELFEAMGDMMKAVNMAKSVGYIPPGAFSAITPLCTPEDFYAENEDGDSLSPNCQDLVDLAIITSIKQAYAGLIDYGDQLYMPTLFGGTFPAFPLVLVDEAQDLSPLNHAMLRKLAKTRLIAVGDPFQSIYGFRGATANGMSLLQQTFQMEVFTLSISFRCPQAIVDNVLWRAPHMKAFRPGGEIRHFTQWSSSDIPDGAAIICRNNAPLFSMALALIKQGRGVTLPGADIGPALVKILKKLGPVETKQDQVHVLINRWESEKLEKAKSPGSIVDRAECLRVFASATSTLGTAIAFAENLFKSSGTIVLLSGHKSKGLEFDTVIHLDSWRVPSKYATSPEAKEQERNVKYVIDTRAKDTLIYAEREAFEEGV